MKFWVWITVFFLYPPSVWAANAPLEIVTQGSGQCLAYDFESTSVYKDPSLFINDMARLGRGTPWRQLTQESPLLTTLEGEVKLRILGQPTQFRNFGSVTRLYRLADPRLRIRAADGAPESNPMVVPVQFCGEGDAYRDSLGFLLAEDLEAGKPRRRRPRLSTP